MRASRCGRILPRVGEDELAARVGRVLNLNGRRNGLGSQLGGILAEAIPAVNGKQAMAASTKLPALVYRVGDAWGITLSHSKEKQPSTTFARKGVQVHALVGRCHTRTENLDQARPPTKEIGWSTALGPISR